MDSSNSHLCSQNVHSWGRMIRHSQAWSRRRIDPPHARSLIFSSPLYCIGASDHLASITAFMSDCLLLRLRLTLHDPLPPLQPSVIAIRSVCPCHSLDSCVSLHSTGNNVLTSLLLTNYLVLRLSSTFHASSQKMFLLNPLVTKNPLVLLLLFVLEVCINFYIL